MYLTRIDFEAMRALDKYYANTERWDLYAAAIRLLEAIDPNPAKVLELGPYKLPLVSHCATMDMRRRPTILHDARETPWPVKNGEFDVFVALQVWEHLGDQQIPAFDEVRRIAKTALLSFPFLWNCKSNPSHHMIDSETIARWTRQYQPTSSEVIPSKSGYRRVLYRFDFE